MSIQSVFVGIRLWAAGKNLITGSTWRKQFGKLQEEVNEAKEAMAAFETGQTRAPGDPVVDHAEGLAKVKDELGDCGVVLTLLAAQHGLNFEDCLEAALAKISKRTGKVVDGVFVKDSY